MIARATTTVSILRGSVVNDFGDEMDNNVVAASGIPASRNQVTQRSRNETASVERSIRRLTFRLPRNTNVVPGDRLGDERRGDICLVDSIKREDSLGIALDLIVKATLVDSVELPGVPVGTEFNPFTGFMVKKVAGPTESILVEHNLGYGSHVSVYVGTELVLASVTAQPNAHAPIAHLVEFEEPQSDVTVVVSL